METVRETLQWGGTYVTNHVVNVTSAIAITAVVVPILQKIGVSGEKKLAIAAASIGIALTHSWKEIVVPLWRGLTDLFNNILLRFDFDPVRSAGSSFSIWDAWQKAGSWKEGFINVVLSCHPIFRVIGIGTLAATAHFLFMYVLDTGFEEQWGELKSDKGNLAFFLIRHVGGLSVSIAISALLTSPPSYIAISLVASTLIVAIDLLMGHEAVPRLRHSLRMG